MTVRPCLVCGEPCRPVDKNADGTYAHDGCLRATSVRPGIPAAKEEAA